MAKFVFEVLQNCYEVRRILLLETAVKTKMLTFVLLSEKSLVVSIWTFFKYLNNHSELERTETPKQFC